MGIPTWVAEVAETEENVGATILVGTKSDYYEELLESGKGSDHQPLKTMEEMYAMAVEVGAAAFVCTSAKNGYGLLQEAEEGAAVGAEGDTMSGQGEQYLDLHVLRCGKAVKNGDSIAALESRAKAAPAPAPAPVVEEKKPKAAPEAPKAAPEAP